MTMLPAGGLLDLLTLLSDCRQESVEKMERRILGVSYMSYWMDFYNDIFCCEFLCVRLISVSFSVSLFRLPRRGLSRPTALFSGNHAEGYNARTDAFKQQATTSAGLPNPSYHAPYKLLGTGGLSHPRVVFIFPHID